MNVHTSEAIVLRHLDYGEADRVVTFFTPEHGILKGFARGARKSRRRFGAALEPFARVCLHWSDSRSGSLAALREAEILDLRTGLRGDLAAFALAGYGVELVAAVLAEGQAQGEIYRLLAAFLDHLAARGGSPEVRLLLELRLLTLAGYGPHLLHCSECDTPLTAGEAAFAGERGGSLCPACARSAPALAVSAASLGSLARCLRTPLECFAGFRLSPLTLREGLVILADAWRPHLHRPLKSLSFLARVLSRDGPEDAGK